MRIGFNPNKDELLTKSKYFHQVIIPVHIPNFEGYFKDSFKILQLCLESLFKTCHSKTYIAIVNNGSCIEVINYLDELYRQEKIQELIHTSPIGKLNAILKGLAGHNFDLVTISDADVLFLNNWQKETIMKVAITGEKGFIGVHLTHYFKYILKYEVVELGRDYLENLSKVKDLDWLIHGACVHRHKVPPMVLTLNTEITNNTLACLQDNNINCNIVLLSSIQEDNESYYGQSKREAKAKFETYCFEIGKRFISFKLPNVFGAYAIPNKTSFIATFCYNLFNRHDIQFNQNFVQLAFVNDVVEIIGKFDPQEIPVVTTTVEEVYFLLLDFKNKLESNRFPNIKNKLEFDLYQTLLSYKNYKK